MLAAARSQWRGGTASAAPSSPDRGLDEQVRESLRRIDHLIAVEEATQVRLAQVEAAAADLTGALTRQSEALVAISGQSERAMEALRLIYEREPEIRERLADLRSAPSYDLAFSEPEPLVSVVVATYRNHRELKERALPSVLAQTHGNLEVIVMGDAAPDEAREAVEGFGDDRFRFANRSIRGPYPEDERQRWLVTGVPPWNEATQLAEGRWIASLDDDDAWRPDHIERLLDVARAARAEMAYGAIAYHLPGGAASRIAVFPPESHKWNMQSSIYHAGLVPLFAPELGDAIFGEPCDWAMVRRMMRAGVRIAFDDHDTVDYYPALEWSDR